MKSIHQEIELRLEQTYTQGLYRSLNPPQGIDIAIAVPTINYPDFIKVKINLKTS